MQRASKGRAKLLSNGHFCLTHRRGGDAADLEEVVLGDVGGQDVLEEDLVDAAHGVHALLLRRQLRPPEEVRPRGQLRLPVKEVEEDGQGRGEQAHAEPRRPRERPKELNTISDSTVLRMHHCPSFY